MKELIADLQFSGTAVEALQVCATYPSSYVSTHVCDDMHVVVIAWLATWYESCSQFFVARSILCGLTMVTSFNLSGFKTELMHGWQNYGSIDRIAELLRISIDNLTYASPVQHAAMPFRCPACSECI